MKNTNNPRGAITAFAAVMIAGSALAADYNWTGLAGNCLWSDSGNWTNAAGVAVAPAVAENVTHSYHFPVDDTGLVVTQDMKGAIIISTLTFERTSTAPVTVEMASKELDCVLYVGSNGTSKGTVTVPEGMTLLWKGDANRWNNQDVIKNGPGKVIFDYLRSPGTQRGFVLNEGTVEVAETSADTYFHVKMGGTDLANPPLFINHKDGGTVGGFDVLRASGTVKLEGTTLNVGADASITGSTNTLPTVIADGGTLVFQNERVAKLSEKTPSFNISLDRADVIAPDFNTANILWNFEDASDPTKDSVGSGSRMVTSTSGSLSVVRDADDATRGNVLSFSDGAYLKGPDADNWLDGFDPADGYTVAFWLKPAAHCDRSAKIFFLGVGAYPAGRALAIRLNDSETQCLMVTAWGGNQTPTTGNLRTGWHHVAVTYSGAPTPSGSDNMRLYVDGANVHSWTVSGYDPQKKDLYIGNMAGTAWASAGDGNPYTGLMDDFIIVNRAFAAYEVAKLYANGTASVFGKTELGDVAAESAGVLAVESSDVSLKTLSGRVFAGGVEMHRAGSTLSVGANAGAADTAFSGVIGGEDSTLVKRGADYALSLSGAAKNVTNVVVEAGTLSLRRPRARAGLVAWYPFDDAGDLGFDASPAGFALVNTNETTALGRATEGACGGSADFPGGIFLSSARNALPSNFPRGNGSFTVSVWIKPTADACTGAVPIFSWGRGSDRQMCMVRFNGAQKINFTTYGSGDDLAVDGLALSDGNWHHLVITYDGQTRKKTLYFDGLFKGEKTISGNLEVSAANSAFEIGHTSVISSRINQFYAGGMDELMVFDYAWTLEEVEAEFDRDAPAAVASTSLLPAPVAHWTFDGENPLAAEDGNPALALAASSGEEVTYESGDAICGKAARFSSTSGFLKLDTFPSGVIPSGNSEFTVIVRYRPDTHGGGYNANVVGWGLSSGWSDGTLFRIASAEYRNSAQAMFNSTTLTVNGAYRTALGTERTRWYTVAAVYQATGYGYYSSCARLYVDGKLVKSADLWSAMALPEQNFTIGDCVEENRRFYGLVDDVQIYDKVLSEGQIRMISEQFETSKGKSETGTAVPVGVLAAQPDVTVADGATLRVESVETVANISGAGSIKIAPLARLNVSSAAGFTGTVTGLGLVGVADGASVDFGDGTSPLLVLDRPLALGANVTVSCTAKSGKMLLARAASFADAANLETWTAILPGGREAKFKIAKNGTELYLSASSRLMLILR